MALDQAEAHRQVVYQELFQEALENELLQDLRSCLQTGTPLGNDRFRAEVEQVLKRKVGHARRGRPKKPPDD